MPDNDVVMAKVAIIQRCLKRFWRLLIMIPIVLMILTNRIYSY